jgi:4-diphosphocytidyl-2-C-methyl-D-erythritol kinase
MIKPLKPESDLRALLLKDIKTWKDIVVNDFEGPMISKFPVIGKIKEKLYLQGAEFASMSGSGSSVYGIFRNPPLHIKEEFKDHFCWTGKLQ